MSDQYRTVTAKIRRVKQMSIMVDVPSRPNWQSVPRSLIHGGDDRKLDDIICGPDGVEHTLRIMAWKAEEIGLA